MKLHEIWQLCGAGCLVAAAWLAWGVEPGLAALGTAGLLFGVAQERS